MRGVGAAAVTGSLLAGCWASTRLGANAPLGHGHGGADGNFDLAGGAEYADTDLDVGGGFDVGLNGPSDHDLISVGLEGHMAVTVGGQTWGDAWRPMLVSHLVLGAGAESGSGSAATGSDAPGAYFAQAFVGFGLGTPNTQESYDIRAGHVALGITASRFWPDRGDPFWMLGAAIELAFGWFQQR